MERKEPNDLNRETIIFCRSLGPTVLNRLTGVLVIHVCLDQ